MQRELTVNLSDETYNGLLKLVGKRNASRFVEAVLRPYILLAGNGRSFKVSSPRLADPTEIEKFRVEIVNE